MKWNTVEQLLNNPQDLIKAVTGLIEDRASLQKQVEKYVRESAKDFRETLLKKMQHFGNFSLIHDLADGAIIDAGIIKDVSLGLRNEKDDLAVIIGANIGNKPHLAVMIPDKLVREKKLHAGEIVKTAAREFDGGGGGQPFFATAGGKNPENLQKALDKAVEILKAALDKD